MSTDTKKRPLFEASIEARLMAERFGKASIGEVVGYEELSALIGQNVRGVHIRSRLHTALRTVQRDKGMVFAVVATVGYKRLADDELPSLGETSIGKIGREARRTMSKMGCADFTRMSKEKLSKFNAVASHLGVIDEFTKPRAVKAIEQAVTKTQQQLPTAKAIEAAFSNGSK